MNIILLGAPGQLAAALRAGSYAVQSAHVITFAASANASAANSVGKKSFVNGNVQAQIDFRKLIKLLSLKQIAWI